MRAYHSGTEPASSRTVDTDTTILPTRASDAASIAISWTADRLLGSDDPTQAGDVIDRDFQHHALSELAWQWDDSLALDPDFSMEDLGTYDLFNACPGNPWLPLRPPDDQHSGHMSGAPQRPPIGLSRRWFNTRFVDLQSSSRPFVSQTTLTPGQEDDILEMRLLVVCRNSFPISLFRPPASSIAASAPSLLSFGTSFPLCTYQPSGLPKPIHCYCFPFAR